MTAPLFPMFLKIADKPCVVVGGGEIARGKVRSLTDCGARVRVVAPELHPELDDLQKAEPLNGRPARTATAIWPALFWRSWRRTTRRSTPPRAPRRNARACSSTWWTVTRCAISSIRRSCGGAN
ncbi:MAG: NAD(P)-dependent oxidoreductase [Deltaproteobacteria bacterium]|nr:NAD(P)-dependent oxidoreductase [Deltaproteobacteria bacterium]